jgi:hypothetical protein
MSKGPRLSQGLAATATTAHRMADAVMFLTRVADDAGMRTIAKKLEAVRGNLLQLETRQSPHSGKAGAPRQNTRGNS